MNSAELLIILVVAILAFGPRKLPMLASHLGKLLFKLNQLKQQVAAFWQKELQELQLKENERKAQKADNDYKNDMSSEN